MVVGERPVDICREMDISASRLSIIMNSPLFMREMKRLERDVYERVVDKVSDVTERAKVLAPKALDVIEAMLENKKEKLKVKEDVPLRLRRDAANDILEMAGSKRSKKNDDGMSDFAQLVSSAFSLAEKAIDANVKTTSPIVINAEATAVVEGEVRGEEEKEAEEVREENLTEDDLALIHFDEETEHSGNEFESDQIETEADMDSVQESGSSESLVEDKPKSRLLSQQLKALCDRKRVRIDDPMIDEILRSINPEAI